MAVEIVGGQEVNLEVFQGKPETDAMAIRQQLESGSIELPFIQSSEIDDCHVDVWGTPDGPPTDGREPAVYNPDYACLVCEAACAEGGGGSLLVDGYAVLASLPVTVQQDLLSMPVERRKLESDLYDKGPAVSIGPVCTY